MRADTLATSVVILLAMTVVQRSIGFGRGILFCRWLTPEALGQWEMVYSFLLLAAPLSVLGVPGSFGRYAEHFRQRGHLRSFLRRTSIWTGVCCVAAMSVVALFAPTFAQLVFGSQQHALLMRGIALCLGAVIMHHTLVALLTSLRLYRAVSAMNFAQSLLFAVISLTLLFWTPRAESILIGYGVGCFLASVGALVWAAPGLRVIDQPESRLAHGEFWPKLLRFAFFVWATNLLTHMFAIVDRYMIVHYSGMSPGEALEQVGHYHSSRIVPLLLVSFADLLAGLILPHLSHDWEAGRTRDVSRRLNLSIKLTSLGMIAFGVVVLALGPALFGIVLQGRYDDGLAVLPWTLAGCVWYGLFLLCQTYLFCAEKTRWAALALAAGLTINVLLNLALLPIWGLYGAVVATAVAASSCTLATIWLSRTQGMQIDRGVWLAALAPAALGFGAVSALLTLTAMFAATICTNLVFTGKERANIVALAKRRLARVRLRRARTSASPNAYR